MRLRKALRVATAIGLLLPGTPGLAQAAPPADETASGDAGDILVIARKRPESILKVPVVVNVLDTASIERAQITNIQGVSTKVPGLFVSESVNTIGTQISLRGIGTSALDSGIDQSISLNIDGQQFSQGLTFKSGLFDLAQAEVLKGPQALFFGKNSPGGVIALTTADPQDFVEVIGRASYEFEAREPRTELILSGPVSDTLGLRLAGSWSDRQGYFKNTAGLTAIPALGGLAPRHSRSGGNENWIVRGTAVWKPTDGLRIKLKVNVTRDRSDNPNGLQAFSCLQGTGPSVVGIPFIGGAHPCRLDDETEIADLNPANYPGVPNGGTPFLDIKQHFGVLDLNYEVAPDVSVSSTTAYYHNRTDGMIQGTYAGAATAIYADNDFMRRDFTEELRVQSDYQDAALNWMVGGFYQKARMKNDIVIGVNTALGFPTTPVGTLAAGTHDVRIETKALFGQLRWKPVETLELAGGVRWTDERRSNTPTTLDAFGALGVPGQTYPVALPRVGSKNWSPEVTVTFTPTDTLTIFGALKQGYKSGSYSITSPTPFGTDTSFGDEKAQGGEFGVKARALDNALNLNAAFYYYRFKGLQVGVSEPAPATGVPVTRTLNAGKARTLGIDFDATYRPPSIEGLSLNLAINWNKAKYIELNGVPCYGGQTIAAGCNQVFNPTATSPLLPGVVGLYTARSASGLPLEKAPVWQIVGGFDHKLSVTEKLDLLFGSSAQYSSSWISPIGDRPDFVQPSFTKLNAYVTLKDAEDRWEVSLIGNNLTDKVTCAYTANTDYKNSTLLTSFAGVTGAATNPTGKIDENTCVANPGREIWVRLTLRPIGLFK